MSRKELLKRKRLIRAYVMRASVALILVVMIVLMFCGCLYIRDFFKKDGAASQSTVHAQVDDTEANSDMEVAPPDNDTEVTEPDAEEPDTFKQYPGISIVLDPGHGGNDGGTASPDGTIVEKHINLAISKEVTSLLEKHGVHVILTREDDSYMSLEERAYFASQKTADLFLSLHCNFFEGDETINGLEAFYCRNAEDSRVFAESIANVVAAQEEIALRGATENNYYVTRHAGMDAVLIEMGFLSNPVEREKLNSPDYQKLLAETIVEGILTAFDNQ